MAISIEEQVTLRKLYDAKVNKNAAAKQTGLAEATVYRYYTKWDALTSKTILDLAHLKPSILREIEIQAGMRRMTIYNFVLLMLTTITTDNLFASIVDIDDDNPVKKRLAKDVKP